MIQSKETLRPVLSSVCAWSHGEMALEQMEEVGSRLETAFAGDFGDRRTRTRQAALHLFQTASCDEAGYRLLLRLAETQLCNATRASQMPHHIAHNTITESPLIIRYLIINLHYYLF